MQIAGNVLSRCGTEQSANKIGRFFIIITFSPYGSYCAEFVPSDSVALAALAASAWWLR